MDPGSGARAFTLDRFQIEAMAAIDDGASVLVAAPTGSGKTVVADHGVDRALALGQRAFYTTPIKALSNQKFHDLRARLGSSQVGLLTGDASVRPDAPVVVMTTEVLRNMLYARSRDLESLGVVVLDEVHFLQDRYRGPVWEEVVIHLPASVLVVALSATVSNADELAGWMETVRGRTATIVEEHRPIELISHYVARDRTSRDLTVLPVVVDGEPNPMGHRLDAPAAVPGRDRKVKTRPRFATPRRGEIVARLADDDLLPAIVFVFSRRGCDQAVSAVWEAGLRLTTAEEAQRIRAIAAAHLEGLSDGELEVLGHRRWLAALEHGIAAHHAGLAPPFKEAVERCFVEGLVKVVFATETLALGINMPARSVVIETLTKFTGEQHEPLTPGQYTQLTGRAGRRGLDEVGQAFVLWSPYTTFQQVADLVLSRRYELRSAFRPSYNMAANLVRRHRPEEARRLLERSFAQHQSDRSVVRLRARRDRAAATAQRLSEEARCERGDVGDYARLLRQDTSSRRSSDHPADVMTALARLRPGDIVWLGDDRVAVLSLAWRGPERARLSVVGPDGRARTVASADVADVLRPVGTVELPQPYAPNDKGFQHETARRMARARTRSRRRAGSTSASAPSHPVAGCPDAAAHVRALGHATAARREIDDLDRRIRAAGSSLVEELDAVLGVLRSRDMVGEWELTRRGSLLVRIFHECDLLIAECLADGLLDGLDPPSLAGVVSCFVYEHRSREPAPAPWFPNAEMRRSAEEITDRAHRLRRDEEDAGLPMTRLPEATFAPLAHAWASGQPLDQLVELDDELTGGDFVRTIRLVMDLLRQIGDAAPDGRTASAARSAADALDRGVVAASGMSGGEVDDDPATATAEADG